MSPRAWSKVSKVLAPMRRRCALSTPLAERYGAIEPFPDRRPPTQPREVCLNRRFIDENQPVRLRAHAGLTVRDPIMAGMTQRRSITFRRDQSVIPPKIRGVQT